VGENILNTVDALDDLTFIDCSQ